MMRCVKKKNSAELVRRLKKKDQDAFAEFYTDTCQSVYLLSYSILKEKYLAEDAVQEVYLKVVDSIGSLRDDKLLYAWLNKITYNVSLTLLDKNSTVIPVNELEESLVSDQPEPLDYVIDQEMKTVLMNKIFKLPEDLKAVVIMKYYGGMKLEEIAAAMDCPVGTVKSRLYNAKKLLRKWLMVKRRFLTFLFLGPGIVYGLKTLGATGRTAGALQGVNCFADSNLVRVPAVLVMCAAAVLLTAFALRPHQQTGGIPEILSVTRQRAWTNTSVVLDIEVNSPEPVEYVEVIGPDGNSMAVEKEQNRLYQKNIGQNGLYYLKVVSRNGTAKQSVQIDNIDRENPVLSNWNYDGEQGVLKVYVKDELSGIDRNRSYRVTEDGTRLPMEWDGNCISYPFNSGSDRLILYDMADNYSIYRISLIEK